MDASPLLKLPPELRIIVYELALFVPGSVEIDVSGLPEEDASQPTPRSHIPALTQTCKHVREEALPIFYATNTFVFTTHELSVSSEMQYRNQSDFKLKDWFTRVGEVAAKCVAKLEINLGEWDIEIDTYTPADIQTIVEEYEAVFAKSRIMLTVTISAWYDGKHFRGWRNLELPMFDLPKAARSVEDMGDGDTVPRIPSTQAHLLDFIELRTRRQPGALLGSIS